MYVRTIEPQTLSLSRHTVAAIGRACQSAKRPATWELLYCLKVSRYVYLLCFLDLDNDLNWSQRCPFMSAGNSEIMEACDSKEACGEKVPA